MAASQMLPKQISDRNINRSTFILRELQQVAIRPIHHKRQREDAVWTCQSLAEQQLVRHPDFELTSPRPRVD